ncbi:FAU ubiquitin-like and ribosomal protein S30 [Schistocerca cancellata]|uniref:FAU ubiquitin-like and ribosomal protein S30 n=2 Tax=Schistocerca TaxID=7008 RepID=UPI0021196638|nr:FAU ubiquitin-like and ribosomal protein S30 [Schistocerca cancellata]
MNSQRYYFYSFQFVKFLCLSVVVDCSCSIFVVQVDLFVSKMMQIHIRGQSNHVIDCEGDECVGQIKERVCHLEGADDVDSASLYCAGAPVADDVLVSALSCLELDFTVSLKGGKVHGSLARAGKVKGQTPKVEKQEKKKKKTGRAKRRIQYNRRFVNIVQTFGRRKGPNSNS